MRIFRSKNYVVLMFFTVLTCMLSCSSEEDSSEIPEASSISQEILQLINTHRASIDKESLETNALATQLAEEHTQFMITENELSHTNSTVRAQTLYNEGNVVKVAEIVANQYKTAAEVVEAWLDSDPHRKNIEGNFTHTGIAAIKNDAGMYYYTQIFLTKNAN